MGAVVGTGELEQAYLLPRNRQLCFKKIIAPPSELVPIFERRILRQVITL
jgi:hypothetical protein